MASSVSDVLDGRGIRPRTSRASGSTSRDLYGRYLGSDGQLRGSPFTILEDAGQQMSVAAAGDGAGHVFLSWQDDRNGNWDVYGALLQPELDVTVIEYDYDDLYRLIGASYTGAISATFAYDYDKVGNMEAFTETITSTATVERYFDDANQLTTSVDASGTTTYTYDLNGNLTMITPPNSGPVTAYAYDQRNLLTAATLGGQPLAGYVYDGQGNRVQQVDHSGAQPITTTYTNDIVGLSQVLVADDGTSEVINLFGLDLISQDDGSQTLNLLVDGLGSVRSEMVGAAVQSTTTYEPYGNLLAQQGPSGTVYGFAGEEEDAATGLLYLRARYFSSYLNRFLTVDPLAPRFTNPQSLNRYSYALGNPARFTDPAGRRECEPQNNGACLPLSESACTSSTPTPTSGSPLPVEQGLQTSLWTKSPLSTSNPWMHAYGNTVLAYEKVYVELGTKYGFSGGLHGGLDLGGSSGDVVIAGTDGRVSQVDPVSSGEGHSAVYVVNGAYTLKYQHFAEISVSKGQDVNPDTPLGKLGPIERRVHLEVRSSRSLHNPLLYFSPPIYNGLLLRIDGIGNPAGETFYQNSAETIPWQTSITQPTIPQNPGYLILERYYGVQRSTTEP